MPHNALTRSGSGKREQGWCWGRGRGMVEFRRSRAGFLEASKRVWPGIGIAPHDQYVAVVEQSCRVPVAIGGHIACVGENALGRIVQLRARIRAGNPAAIVAAGFGSTPPI